MVTPDGRKKSKTYHILELELRDGMEEGLLQEKAALEKAFCHRGLTLLQDRKVMLGFALLEPEMSAKQRHAYEDARARNRRIEQTSSPEPELLAA